MDPSRLPRVIGPLSLSPSLSLSPCFPLTAYPLRRPNAKETTSPCPVPLVEVLGVSLIDPTMVTFYL